MAVLEVGGALIKYMYVMYSALSDCNLSDMAASRPYYFVLVVAIIAHQGDCQCQQNFDFPGGGFDQSHAIVYDIFTCLRCEENTFTILVAGSGVSPAPLTNSTSGVTIIPPSGSEPEYTLMIPVPRDVLSNTADTIIGCTTSANQEGIRFSELVFDDPILNPNGTINVLKGTNGSLSCSLDTSISGIDARWTFGSTTLATSTDNVIYSYTDIMRNESGEYNCTLEHSIGSGSAPRYTVTRSMAVTINVQYPELSAITNLANTNGKLVITWSFTGGAPLTSVAVSCRSEEEGSGSGLASDMSCSGNMCGDGMAVIPTGPENVTAGMKYSCTINATNELSSMQQDTKSIFSTSGTPSLPRILSVEVGASLTAKLKVQLYAGHSSLLNITFFAISPSDITTSMSQTITSPMTHLMNYSVELPLPPGVYHFTVSSKNLFGTTRESSIYPPVERSGIQVSSRTVIAQTFGLGSALGICVIIIAIQFALIFMLLYKFNKRTTKLPNNASLTLDKQYETVPVTAERQQQKIELMSNAAYASCMTK